jgi:hypothetical protein
VSAVASDERAASGRRGWTLSGVVLAVAALSTTWSAFQAAVWTGTQLAESSQSSRYSRLAIEKQLEGDRRFTSDSAHFSTYLDAKASGHEGLATLLYEREAPELRFATDAWLSTRPFDSERGPQSPLSMPEYQVRAWQEASDFRARSDEKLNASLRATSYADDYVFGTVLFAAVSALAGAAPTAGSERERRRLARLSAICLAGVIAFAASRPIQLRRAPVQIETSPPLEGGPR